MKRFMDPLNSHVWRFYQRKDLPVSYRTIFLEEIGSLVLYKK